MHDPSPQPDGDSRPVLEPRAEDAYQRAIDDVAFKLIRAAALRAGANFPAQPKAIPGWETFRVAALKAMAWTDSGAKGAALANTILDIAEADDVDELESRDAQLVRRAILTYEAHLTQQGELVGRS